MHNGLFGPVKNEPVLLPHGAILGPSSTEFNDEKFPPDPVWRSWRVHFERRPDGGKTWQFIGPVNDGMNIAAIQPSLLIHPGNRFKGIGRSQQGRLRVVWSE